MSENKLKSKRKWVQNAIAELKPFIERKEHITRSTAGKLLKPVTNWQRREVDTLRKQANQIIRGENVNAMVYTIFGMTLDHPELKPVKEMFDATIRTQREPYAPPNNLKVRGVMPSEYAVFYNEDGSRREVLGGDVWIIRNNDGSSDSMIIENDQTYVLIKDTLKFPPVASTGYRCIYPECVVVAEIELVEPAQPDEPAEPPLPPPADLVLCTKAYALSKEKENGDCYLDDDGCLKAWTGKSWLNLGVVNLPGPARNGPIILNWVKNIETMADLPDNPEPGDMVGVYNGRHFEPDVYMVWTVQQQWCELARNDGNEEEIRAAQMRTLGQRFGVLMEEKIANDFKQTFAGHQHTGEPTTAPVKRTNPRYTIWVADEQTSAILNESYRNAAGLINFTTHDGDIYFRHLDKWCQSPHWFGTVEGDPGIHHGALMYHDVTPYTTQLPQFKSHEHIKELEARGELQPGDTYINQADHIVMWANNEWTDMGKFNHNVGYIRTSTGEVYPKSRNDILADHLGCKLSGHHFVNDWTELPENPVKGDHYLMHSTAITPPRETVFDGEIWIETEAPYHPIAIPEYVVMNEKVGDVTSPEMCPNWKFEEPKPNPNGFWSRVGRVLGFK